MGRVSGKIALITGAASGIGKASAVRLAEEGAKVILTDVNEKNLQIAVAEIEALGGEAIYSVVNVTDESDWLKAIKLAEDTFGIITTLVNCAGIRAREKTIESWKQEIDINLNGSFLGMHYLIPKMQQNGEGSIVNIASLAALGGSGLNGYTASKGAIRAISRGAAVDFAKDNIRVNSIYPGMIITGMTEGILLVEELKNHFESTTPLPRLGAPEDIANGVLYLVSDEASFVTGAELVIDGGVTAS